MLCLCARTCAEVQIQPHSLAPYTEVITHHKPYNQPDFQQYCIFFLNHERQKQSDAQKGPQNTLWEQAKKFCKGFYKVFYVLQAEEQEPGKAPLKHVSGYSCVLLDLSP